MIIRNLLLIASLITLTACQRKLSPDTLTEDPDVLFQRAQTKLAKSSGRHLSESIEIFEKIIQIHPYSSVAPDAQFLLILANQKNGTHASAIANADTFLHIYPSHEKACDAIFLRAYSYYAQTTGSRDIEPALNALQNFKILEKRCPGAHKSARQTTMQHLEDILASSLMKQARKLYKRKSVIGALTRYKKITHLYTNSRFVDEAFFRMAECLLSLGIVDQAEYCVTQIQSSFWIKKGRQLQENFRKKDLANANRA